MGKSRNRYGNIRSRDAAPVIPLYSPCLQNPRLSPGLIQAKVAKSRYRHSEFQDWSTVPDVDVYAAILMLDLGNTFAKRTQKHFELHWTSSTFAPATPSGTLWVWRLNFFIQIGLSEVHVEPFGPLWMPQDRCNLRKNMKRNMSRKNNGPNPPKPSKKLVLL